MKELQSLDDSHMTDFFGASFGATSTVFFFSHWSLVYYLMSLIDQWVHLVTSHWLECQNEKQATSWAAAKPCPSLSLNLFLSFVCPFQTSSLHLWWLMANTRFVFEKAALFCFPSTPPPWILPCSPNPPSRFTVLQSNQPIPLSSNHS